MKLNITRIIGYILFCFWSYVKSTESETFNQSGIFGSFKLLMNNHDKTKLTVKKTNIKVNKLTPPTVTLGDVAGSSLTKGIIDQAYKNRGDPTFPAITLGEAPYFSGWIQYFKYSTDRGLEKPSSFFKNNEYYKQQQSTFPKKKEELNKKDSEGQFKYIPKLTYFYATLFDNTLNIANSKEVSTLLII